MVGAITVSPAGLATRAPTRAPRHVPLDTLLVRDLLAAREPPKPYPECIARLASRHCRAELIDPVGESFGPSSWVTIISASRASPPAPPRPTPAPMAAVRDCSVVTSPVCSNHARNMTGPRPQSLGLTSEDRQTLGRQVLRILQPVLDAKLIDERIHAASVDADFLDPALVTDVRRGQRRVLRRVDATAVALIVVRVLVADIDLGM